MDHTSPSPLLRRLPGLIALIMAVAGLVLAFAYVDAQPVSAVEPVAAAPLIPRATILTPISDTYEVNNFQSQARELNPGFPYASIQCGVDPGFSDFLRLIGQTFAKTFRYTQTA